MEVELDKPLLRGNKIKLGGEVLWVDFAYEMLPTFCFYCSLISHAKKTCERKIEKSGNDNFSEGQYGS